MIGSYFCSWSSKWSYQKEELDIKDVESDIIYISFAQPDCAYQKGSFEGTGLSFSSSFEVVAGACELLKDTKTVMLSVGGGTYHGWSALNVDAIIALANDLHCKGIDSSKAAIQMEDGSFDIIKKPKLLHSTKANDLFIRKLAHNLSCKLIFKKIT
jgi:hypothetical protein